MTKPSDSATWLAWLQLFRIPNVFTALADVWMGYWFVNPSMSSGLVLLMLSLSSALLYTAGMVLNDAFDVQQDRIERPNRPIPSGRITLHQAQKWGTWFLVAGIWCGWLAGQAAGPDADHRWRAGSVATLLAGAVLLYDMRLKRTLFGPLGMGACRALNVLLGMSLTHGLADAGPWTFHPAQWWVAGGIGLYIVGVTLFARTEARASSRRQLVAALCVMLAGYALLGLFPVVSRGADVPWRVPVASTWWLMLAVIAVPLVRRCVVAIVRPEPQRVQAAVKFSILSLIVMDAAVCFAARGPLPALAIVALIVPALWLGHIVYST